MQSPLMGPCERGMTMEISFDEEPTEADERQWRRS